nr:phage tail protein [Aurantimonas aggregata]
MIAAILDDHGIGNYDVSGVEASVAGFVVSGPDTARRSLEELMRLTGTLAHAPGGRLVFRSLARVSPATAIDAFVDDEGAYVERRRGEAGETAEEISLSFLDPARAYQPGSAEAARAGAAHPRKEIVDLPVVLEEGEARVLAAAMLQEAAGVSETARFAVAPSLLGLETGDVVTLAERSGEWLVTRIETGAARRVEARRLPPRRRAMPDQGAPGPAPQPGRPGLASRPVVHLLDLPLPDGGEGIAGARFAVVAKPWVPYAITAAGVDGPQERRATATRPATAGILSRALAAGPVGIVDRTNRPRVRLHRGALASISKAAMLDGGNLCAVECAPGLWEVLQFETTEEVAPGEFELRGLLRAQGGTEDAMALGAEVGAAFVLLDAGAGDLGLTSRDVGRSLSWRIAPLGRPLDDPATVTLSAALGSRSVKPLSPVHLRWALAADGSLTAAWIRRTRVGGDGWDGIDVPLGEERELYRIEITDGAGGLLVREADGPALVVPAGEVAAAFGTMPAALTLSVAQVSPQWGAGTARSTVISRLI